MNSQNNTLAGNKSIGFDYQFYYFFYLLLGLRHGEAVGLESKDDVHVDFSDGRQQLIQTKHTVQKNSTGEAITLTTLDSDLWKTLSNWTAEIERSNDVNIFLEKTEFLLVTNKTLRTNKTLNKMSELRNGSITPTYFKNFLKTLSADTQYGPIKEYISNFAKLPVGNLKSFVKNLNF